MQKQYTRFSQNPITRAELIYQDQPAPPRRRWRRFFGWIGRALTIFSYVFALILVVSEVVIALLLNFNGLSGMTLSGEGEVGIVAKAGILNFIPLCVVVVMHFSLMIQTLSRSANSVSRERQANNWDTLVLTGINANYIVWGKWWATVRSMWRPYLRLALFRAAIIIGYGVYIARPYYFGYAYNNPNYDIPDIIAPSFAHFFLAVFFICAMTFANLFFTAACGVTAFNKRSSIALARAIGTRLLILVVIALISVAIGFFLLRGTYYYYDPTVSRIAQVGVRALATLFDNGVSMGGEIITYRYSYTDAYYSVDYYTENNMLWLLGVLLALAGYAILTYLLLRFAQWQAVRLNALPPPRVRRRKLIEIA